MLKGSMTMACYNTRYQMAAEICHGDGIISDSRLFLGRALPSMDWSSTDQLLGLIKVILSDQESKVEQENTWSTGPAETNTLGGRADKREYDIA